MRTLAGSFALTLTLAGCPSPRPAVDAGSDAPLDARALPDAARPDAFCGTREGVDASGPDAFRALPMSPTAAIELDTSTMGCMGGTGRRTQIHPTVVFDGEAVWASYVAVCGEESTFDVFATRIALDGTVLVPPFQVNTAPASNEIDPVMAASPTQVLIAWTGDDGSGGTANLQVGYRLFDHAGAATTRSEQRLVTSLAGVPQTDNHMAHDALFVPGHGLAIAGVRANSEVNRFQAYAQFLDAGGTSTSETIAPPPEAVSHNSVTFAFHRSAQAFLAFDRGDEGTNAVLWRESCAGRYEMLATGVAPTGMTSDGTRVFVGLGGAFVTLLELRESTLGTPFGLEDTSGRSEILPSLALGPSGQGAALWIRLIAGSNGELAFSGFRADGTTTPARSIVPERVAPYPPELARIDDTHYVAVWSAGMSPMFKVYAQFLTL